MTRPTGHQRRRLVGGLGEALAAAYLVQHGAVILGRNVELGRGEIDLHVRFGATVVAVEVKAAVRSTVDPLEHFDDAKAARVRALARRLEPPAYRIDVVAITFDRAGASVRWLADAA